MMNIDTGRYWDKAWTLVEGCSPVSAGCDNCWSASMTHRFKKGFTKKGKFNGVIRIREDRLDLPLKTKKPTVWSIWNDLFHEDVPLDLQIDSFMVMGFCERHTFLVLTKRPNLMAKFMRPWLHATRGKGITFQNIYFGTSIENQQAADERIPYLLKIPGKRFLSIEPMLGEIIIPHGQLKEISQVICGGETGPTARPCHPDWVRSLRDQCKATGVPFFFKGWGGRIETENNEGVKMGDIYMSSDGFIDVAKRGYVCFASESEGTHIRRVKYYKDTGRLLDGRTHDELVWRIWIG